MSRNEFHAALLREMEQACNSLPLCQKPEDIVIGKGNLDSDIMFIGEAPGENEALQRTPFVGRAGQLLNKVLLECGMRREDMYVTNIVKVRPPGNRDPEPAEIAAYLPYLLKEIDLIKPKLFITLGRFSMNFFLPDAKISAVHGVLQRFWWEGRITYLLPQYHPAAALRGTRVLELFRADIAKIPKALAFATKKQSDDEELITIKEAIC